MMGEAYRLLVVVAACLTLSVSATRMTLRRGMAEKLVLITVALYSARVVIAQLQNLNNSVNWSSNVFTLIPILSGLLYAVVTIFNVGTSAKRNARKYGPDESGPEGRSTRSRHSGPLTPQ